VHVLEVSHVQPVVPRRRDSLSRRGISDVQQDPRETEFDGVLVGRPAARSHVEDNPPEWRADYRDRQRDAITDVFETYNPDAPLVLDCEFGHTYPTCPIPIGGEVEIDPRTESIRFP